MANTYVAIATTTVGTVGRLILNLQVFQELIRIYVYYCQPVQVKLVIDNRS
jgi:hypothetical protein